MAPRYLTLDNREELVLHQRPDYLLLNKIHHLSPYNYKYDYQLGLLLHVMEL